MSSCEAGSFGTGMSRGAEVMDACESESSATASPEEVVLVAVDGSRSLTEYALDWALANVVLQPGDRISFLAVLHGGSSSNFLESGWKRWGLPALSGECSAASSVSRKDVELRDLHAKCSRMIEKLRKVREVKKVHFSVDVVQSEEHGLVLSEANKIKSTWVVLDRHLKKEARTCLEGLKCNIVVVNRSSSKILRLNLKRRNSPAEDFSGDSTSLLLNGLSLCMIPKGFDQLYWEGFDSISGPSSPEPNFGTPLSSFDKQQRLKPQSPFGKPSSSFGKQQERKAEGTPSSSFDKPGPSTSLERQLKAERELVNTKASVWKGEALPSDVLNNMNQEKHVLSDYLSFKSGPEQKKDRYRQPLIDRVSSVRKQMHLSKQASPQPPPLCTICQHKAPVFGKPPLKFTYAELEFATAGFSDANFLAEGGFGSVYRGSLTDGQQVAVKQHKLASSQGDKEFCSEVEVLSCAQQRNLVTLIGYCVEETKRLLVYEYVCNGSLDSHLYGKRSQLSILSWSARQKIAVGAARALRYLHEECRVGCIVHRDMRPNNILLTHDFEPMVGDFGLARWQPDGNRGVETRVIGAFGYLAPEYTQTGQVTEKADVYSFGIVLLELVTGRKAVDLSRSRGEMCLSEWARPLLLKHNYCGLVDHSLEGKFQPQEAETMLHTAALCIDPNPFVRPRMSQVLRLLEGDMVVPNSESPQSVLSPGVMRLSSFSSSSNSGSPLKIHSKATR